jgi:hypothetical protein
LVWDCGEASHPAENTATRRDVMIRKIIQAKKRNTRTVDFLREKNFDRRLFMFLHGRASNVPFAVFTLV